MRAVGAPYEGGRGAQASGRADEKEWGGGKGKGEPASKLLFERHTLPLIAHHVVLNSCQIYPIRALVYIVILLPFLV